MPQSSVSRHLKTLADDGWVTSRRDGTSRFYSMPLDGLGPGVRGGKVVAEGTIDAIQNCHASLTGAYLSGRRTIEIPKQREKVESRESRVESQMGSRGRTRRLNED